MAKNGGLSSVKVRSNTALNGDFDWKEEIKLPVWLWMIIATIRWWFRHKVVTATVVVGIIALFVIGFDPMVLVYMGLTLMVVLAVVFGWIYSRYDYGPTARRLCIAFYRRMIVRKRWWKAIKAAGFKKVPKLKNIHFSPNGINGTVRTNEGQNSIALAAGSLDVAAVLSAQDFRVDDSEPGLAKVSIIWGDPTELLIFPEDLADAHNLDDKSTVAFAVDNDHGPCNIGTDTSVLIVGESGSGKSNALWSYISGLNEKSIPYDLWVADPAGGVELSVLKGGPHVKDYKVDPNEITQMFHRMYSEMQERLRVMESRGIRKIIPGDEEFPLNIAIVDEWLLVGNIQSSDPAGKILAAGRKAGFVIIALSQLAQKSTLQDIRDLFPQRICHSTKSKGMTDAALGEGAEAAGARCSKIAKSTPGVGYYYSLESRIYTRFRTPLIEDEATHLIAQGEVVRIRSKNKQVSKKKKFKKLLQMPTAVYQFYNSSGRLLYVGITNNVERRFGQHEESKPWWNEIDHDLTEVKWYPKRKTALQTEKELIQTQYPLYNKQHSRLND